MTKTQPIFPKYRKLKQNFLKTRQNCTKNSRYRRFSKQVTRNMEIKKRHILGSAVVFFLMFSQISSSLVSYLFLIFSKILTFLVPIFTYRNKNGVKLLSLVQNNNRRQLIAPCILADSLVSNSRTLADSVLVSTASC